MSCLKALYCVKQGIVIEIRFGAIADQIACGPQASADLNATPIAHAGVQLLPASDPRPAAAIDNGAVAVDRGPQSPEGRIRRQPPMQEFLTIVDAARGLQDLRARAQFEEVLGIDGSA